MQMRTIKLSFVIIPPNLTTYIKKERSAFPQIVYTCTESIERNHERLLMQLTIHYVNLKIQE